MGWLVPENMLDDQQRNFVESADITKRNVWIKGFPGSGKSVLLAYTLKKIKVREPEAKVAVVVFTRSIIEMFKAAFAEMGVSANIMTFYEFLDGSQAYDYILSDEVQDMTGRVLLEMSRRAKHVIVAGDENQSIYESDPRFREPTVSPSEIMDLLDCRGYELGIIHRLSKSIITAVEKFMPNMNIFSSKRDMNKRDTQIRVCAATSSEQEVEYVIKEAQKAINVGETAAILIPSQGEILNFIQMVLFVLGKDSWEPQTNYWGKTNFGQLNEYLRRQGVKIQYVGNGYGNLSNSQGRICVMTYHSSKGLDFDNVFLPYLNRELYITSNESLSRILFMVAMTRSRNNLYLSHSGRPSGYLSNFASDCSRIDVEQVLGHKQSTTKSGGNIFGI